MADQPSPEEIKQQCPFCQIVAGKIPSKKVFEDDRLLAILDIRPALKGHTLVMPKEHYPILPLLARDEFEHLITRSAQLCSAVRDAMLSRGCTLFIANGGVAGQQTPHFLLHIIPREQGDDLGQLDLAERSVDQSSLEQPLRAYMERLFGPQQTEPVVVESVEPSAQLAGSSEDTGPEDLAKSTITSEHAGPRHAQAIPASTPKMRSQPTKSATGPNQDAEIAGHSSDTHRAQRHQKVALLLSENPDLKQALMQDPSRFQAAVDGDPAMREVFEGIDLHKLAAGLRAIERQQSTSKSEQTSQDRTEPQQKRSQVDLDSISSLFLGGAR